MPLIFAAITPHPPIIVPGVGSQADLAKCQKTVQGMQELGRRFHAANVDTIIIMSPHSPTVPESFTVNTADPMTSDLEAFDSDEAGYTLHPDMELIKTLSEVTPFESPELDHGVNVPLHFLLQWQDQPELVSLGYKNEPAAAHFAFGKRLGKIIDNTEKKIAFIASGDLSHMLTPEAPAGYSPAGKDFDSQLVATIRENNYQDLLSLEESLAPEAGECGLRSIATLLGVLQSQKPQPDVLSYEGPFGVGYLVTAYKLK